MTPYNVHSQSSRLHHVAPEAHMIRKEFSISDMISSGAYRSVRTIGRLINALKSH